MAQEHKKHAHAEDDRHDAVEPADAHLEAAAEAGAPHEEEEAGAGSEAAEADPEALRAEIAALKDRYLRAAAEIENVRKRADRDRRDAELYGITRFARDLLSVHDNFERAMKAVTDEARAAAGPLLEGIELTQKELLSALSKHGVRKISPERGERFDPKLHQAMFEAPVPGTGAGDIIEVMAEGFTIGERLLRPAQVGVSAGGPPAAKPAPAPAEAEAPEAPEAGSPTG